MESSINERIKAVFDLRGEKSVRAYALKRNLAPTTFGECLKGAEPRFSLLKAFLDGEPCVSAEWLMRGAGEMFLKEESIESAVPSQQSESEDVQFMRERIISLESENRVLREMLGLQRDSKQHVDEKIAL